jgi:RNA ligase (TIGR02306 family)
MERKLASIQTILDIQPIEGADLIEVAKVNDWKLVTKKGEFKIGDKAIYCEIDSFLPIREEFEFLRKSSYKKMLDVEGFRLKTIRLRGQISQGLLLPLSILKCDDVFNVGDDVTELLGIIKYEKPLPAELAGLVKGNFPSFIPKTDEERIQNCTKYYEEYRKHLFYETEKLDGSSETIYLNNNEFGVCSRNLDLLETEGNTFWSVARKLKIEEKLKEIGYNVAIQGELIGEGIQGNPYKIKGQTLRIFNIFNIDKQEYLNLNEFKETLKKIDLESVPILSENIILPETIEELILSADGKSVLNLNFSREGKVIRSHDRTISFKVISNDFLLKEK